MKRKSTNPREVFENNRDFIMRTLERHEYVRVAVPSPRISVVALAEPLQVNLNTLDFQKVIEFSRWEVPQWKRVRIVCNGLTVYEHVEPA